MPKLSAVILAKNEERTIEKCIRSVNFCDEIIVIDDESVDRTGEIAKSLGALVYKRDLNNNFSQQRNYALEKVTSEWVLFIDADEIVSENLKQEIKNAMESNNYDAFNIKRVDIFKDKKLIHGETGNIKFVRLAKRGFGKWKRSVHERWEIKGRVGSLKGPILHYSHESLAEFISSVEYYSSLHARENYNEGKKSNIFKIIMFPFLKFVYNYFLKLGFLDGTRGMIYACLMSFHSYLSWSKLWLMQKELMSKKY